MECSSDYCAGLEYHWRAGISDMRNALEEKVAEKLKNKGKQRMRPKMGKMDIDYSILHDAFFKYQDKPTMAQIGDMYYEGAVCWCCCMVLLCCVNCPGCQYVSVCV